VEKEIVFQLQHHRWTAGDPLFMLLTDYVSVVTFFIIAIMLWRIYRKKDQPRNIYFLLTALLVSAGITHLLKWAVHRPRPYTVSEGIDAMVNSGGYAFPSGHSAEVFVLVFGLWMLYKNKYLRLIILLWALFIAYTRMAFGVHYPTDIMGGIITAAFSVWIARRIFPGKKRG